MMHDSNSTGARTALLVVAMAAAVGLLLAGAVMPATADGGAEGTANETTNGDEDTNNNEGAEECDADIDAFDVHTADSIVDGADDPARVGVSASTSITNQCPVIVQVTFDIPNDMYYQGTSAGSSGQGLQTEVFEVGPGEVASFTTTMYANQPGDRTVTADVEYFPEGQPEDARSLNNLMLTFDVQDPVPEEDWPDPEDAEPVDGEANQPDDPPGDNSDDNNGSGGDGPSNDDDDDDGILDALAENLVAVLALIGVISIGTIVAWKGRDMLVIKS